MTAHFRQQGSVLQGTQQGTFEGYEIEFSADSEEPPGKIASLIRLARKMCFAEAALSQKASLVDRYFLNGQPLEE